MRKLMSENLSARSLELLGRIARLGAREGLPVYVVGGFVRDLLLGIENLDIDVVVEAREKETGHRQRGDGILFARALAEELKAEVTPHPRFGTTVLELPDGGHLDVATARRESYSQPGALPDVEPGTIEEDMARRDFSINSLAMRLSGEEAASSSPKDLPSISGKEWTVLDLHNGVRDLENKTIRVLHGNSFEDDPTRIFRAVRFEQRLSFTMEKYTEEKLRQALRDNRVDALSGHRVFNELAALLQEADFLKCLRRMADLEIFKAIEPGWNPEETDFQLLAKIPLVSGDPIVKKNAAPADPLRLVFLGLLWRLDEDGVDRVLKRLDPPGKLKAELQGDRGQAQRILESLTDRASLDDLELYRLLIDSAPEPVIWAMAVASPDDGAVDSIRRFYGELRHKGKVALTGEDLIRLGLKPGPEFQKIFEDLLKARLEGRVSCREDEEKWVRQRYSGHGPTGK